MSSGPPRQTGVLADWNDERGFGFIQTGAGRIFAHISDFDPTGGRPQVGDFVAYEVGQAPDGRSRAVLATRVFARPTITRSARGRAAKGGRGRVEWVAFVPVAAFGSYLALAIAQHGVSPWFALFYLVMSLLTFIDYAADKRAAVAGAWRTRERSLQVAALLGGWPGGVLAQQFVRHKNRKPSFQIIFWLAAMANVAGFLVLTIGLPG